MILSLNGLLILLQFLTIAIVGVESYVLISVYRKAKPFLGLYDMVRAILEPTAIDGYVKKLASVTARAIVSTVAGYNSGETRKEALQFQQGTIAGAKETSPTIMKIAEGLQGFLPGIPIKKFVAENPALANMLEGQIQAQLGNYVQNLAQQGKIKINGSGSPAAESARDLNAELGLPMLPPSKP